MSKDPWAAAVLAEPPAGWIPATENGWGALVVWAAGLGNFVRVPKAAGDRHGIMIHQSPDGSERHEPFLLTGADLVSIDDDIDSYLADAGLPPRPRGYDWFIRRPANANQDSFWGAAWAAATAALRPDDVRPSTLKGPAQEALTHMYQG